MQNKILIATAAILVLLSALFFINIDDTPENAALEASNVMLEGSAYQRPYSPIIGEVNAPVTIVEFFDPSCEA